MRKSVPIQIPYKFAPILEAVIDIQFTSAKTFKPEWFNTLKRKIAAEYPTMNTIVENSFTLHFEAVPQLKNSFSSSQEQTGFRFESADGKRILQVRKDRFTYSLMAPYSKWDTFSASARAAWVTFSGIFKPAAITQLGLRYVNRIDIPAPVIKLEDYFALYPHIPDTRPVGGFILRFPLSLDDDHKAIVTQAATPPPKEGMSAILLDIDIIRAGAIKKESIWTDFAHMRKLKNDLFESFITPQSRKLFNHVNTKS